MYLVTQLVNLAISHPYLSAFLTIIAIYNYFNRGKKCDLPGPHGFPLVGYLPFLLPRPYEGLTKLAKKYGPIYQVQIGRTNTVILSTLEIGTEAFSSGLAFQGRPDSFSSKTFGELSNAAFSFLPANENWRVLRKIASRSLGIFASSRNSKLENVVHEAHEYMDSNLDSHLGKPFKPQTIILDTAAAVIGSIVFGFDFDIDNDLVKQLHGTNKVVSDFFKVGGVADNVPFAKYLVADKVKAFKDAILPVNRIIDSHMAKHQYSGAEEDVRDVADALVKASEQANPRDLAAAGVDKGSIRNVASDLFGAGFATTSDSFHWFLNLMAVHQGVQQRCQQKIDSYLAGRQISLEDKGKIAYIDATITEMFRFTTLAPLGLPHSMMEDVQFRGYFIPKGTVVHLNMYAIHYDPETYPEPDQFKPERFLREDGTYNMEKSAKVIPFGVGKRRCVGETLVRQELFMLLVSTLQKYSIQLAPGQKVNFAEGDYGSSRVAHNLDLIFQKRQ